MITLTYVTIAIAFLILVLGLNGKARSKESDECRLDVPSPHSPVSGRWLHLSERIFDPSDARWLADELAFPKLAKALVAGRKRLALRWLEALQESFDEVVRTPELFPSGGSESSSLDSWQMLWLTLRFKLVISYAMFVVRTFGPYHRLLPTFSWVPLPEADERSFRRPVLVDGRGSLG